MSESHFVLPDRTTAISGLVNHAIHVYPEECCGLILNNKYFPCCNESDRPCEHFRINPTTIALHWDKVEAICHSHPNQVPVHFSEGDLAQMQLFECRWIVVGIARIEGKYQTSIEVRQ